MRVVLISPEAVPFSKTGGLADVASGLSRALAELGHEVTLIVPYHRRHLPESIELEPHMLMVSVDLAGTTESAQLWETRLPPSDVRVVMIDHPGYFARPGLYVGPEGDYHDNAARYIFFSRAALRACEVLKLRPDVVHANDWQTGLVPATTCVEWGARLGRQRPAAVMTLHNLAFQGLYDVHTMLLTGLDWSYFNWQQMEFYGKLNLLKTGIAFADVVTTVSPTYAREVRSSELGWGLQGVLEEKGDRFVGVLNGIDDAEWNPETDPHLPARYSVDTLETGKARCKQALQAEFQLPVRPDAPLFGMISRITSQKGFDLIESARLEILKLPAQFVFLGTGDERMQQILKGMSQEAPEKVAVRIGFDEGLAHRIEAGCDLYLMPSHFEPCGLNQFYSMRYGAVPIATRSGGLADSVTDASDSNLAAGKATGFQLASYSVDSLLAALHRAIDMYQRQPQTFRKVIETGMRTDWSWRGSARRYAELYERALEGVRHPSR
jgi:starch synthase